MARQIVWAIALVALIPSIGRASELGVACDREQAPQQRGAHPQPPPGAKPDNHQDDHQPPKKWWIDAKLRTDLSITDSQSAEVEKIWQKSFGPLREGRERLTKLEDTLSTMTDTADEAAVFAQIEKVENLRAELAKGRAQMIYRMNRLLTPDQRAKVQQMYERREPPKRDGRNSSRR